MLLAARPPGSGVFDAAAGERLYDGSYDHTAATGTANRAGYASVKALEDPCIATCVYCYTFTVLTLTAGPPAGVIDTFTPPVMGRVDAPQNLAAGEMGAVP